MKYLIAGVVCVIFALSFCEAAKTPEEEVAQILDNAEKQQNLYLFGGLSIRQVDGESAVRAIPSNSLVGRIENYFKTHKLHFEFPEEETLENGELSATFTFRCNSRGQTPPIRISVCTEKKVFFSSPIIISCDHFH